MLPGTKPRRVVLSYGAAAFIKGDWDEDEEKRLLPARQLDFRDPRTARIFEETHNLGNWVID